MKKGLSILLVLLFALNAYADLDLDREAFLNMRIIQLEGELQEEKAARTLELNKLTELILELDSDLTAITSVIEEPDEPEVSTINETDPSPTDPQFWITVIVGVVMALGAIFRKSLVARLHTFGREEAAKRGHPSAQIILPPEPIVVDGHTGVVEPENEDIKG